MYIQDSVTTPVNACAVGTFITANRGLTVHWELRLEPTAVQLLQSDCPAPGPSRAQTPGLYILQYKRDLSPRCLNLLRRGSNGGHGARSKGDRGDSRATGEEECLG